MFNYAEKSYIKTELQKTRALLQLAAASKDDPLEYELAIVKAINKLNGLKPSIVKYNCKD